MTAKSPYEDIPEGPKVVFRCRGLRPLYAITDRWRIERGRLGRLMARTVEVLADAAVALLFLGLILWPLLRNPEVSLTTNSLPWALTLFALQIVPWWIAAAGLFWMMLPYRVMERLPHQPGGVPKGPPS